MPHYSYKHKHNIPDVEDRAMATAEVETQTEINLEKSIDSVEQESRNEQAFYTLPVVPEKYFSTIHYLKCHTS